MPVRIAINGYGRIGRDLHRQLLDIKGIEIVAVNSRSDAESHAHLLKYDSLYGKCNADIQVKDGNLVVNGKTVYVYQVADPAKLEWKKHKVDIVIESTGKFTAMEDVEKHLIAGAKKVIVTAPCKDMGIPNIVMGVNDKDYNSKDYKVISNASCTTNCLAPMLYILNEEFGVEMSFVTTLHAFTYTQNLLDNSNPDDFRRARATTESIIPTTTGAMKAISRVISALEGKVDGIAFRVPVPTVSCIDMVCKLKKNVSVEDINKAYTKWSKKMPNYIGVSNEPLVSVDYRGDTRSAIIDLLSTSVLSESYVKVLGWYDNEWGYVSRVVDLIKWFK